MKSYRPQRSRGERSGQIRQGKERQNKGGNCHSAVRKWASLESEESHGDVIETR